MRQNQNPVYGSLRLITKVSRIPTGSFKAETTINGQRIEGPEARTASKATVLLRQIVQQKALMGTINMG